jgi:hypothetical protein
MTFSPAETGARRGTGDALMGGRGRWAREAPGHPGPRRGSEPVMTVAVHLPQALDEILMASSACRLLNAPRSPWCEVRPSAAVQSACGRGPL